MKTIILFLFILIGAACTSSMPTDEEMINHFTRHRIAFDRCVSLLHRDTLGCFYPPYNNEQTNADDSLYFATIPRNKASELDTLLHTIKIERVFFYHKRANKSLHDSLTFVCEFPYHSVGISVSGSTKGFVYHPNLKTDTFNHIYVVNTNLDKTPISKQSHYFLYRPLVDGWFLYYEYDQ